MRTWYERTDPVFDISHHFLSLYDIALAQGHEAHTVLKGTAVFPEDLNQGAMITPAQLDGLVSNVRQLKNGRELSFRWGQLLWPGHYGPYSQLLMGADSLARLLQVFTDFGQSLCPLLKPSVSVLNGQVYIDWRDAMGVADNHQFYIEAYMSGMVSVVEWLSGYTLPWRFGFSAAKPGNLASLSTHLGASLDFAVGVDVMVVEACYLQDRWGCKQRSQTGASMFKRNYAQCLKESAHWLPPFLEHITVALTAQSSQSKTLEEVAAQLGVSPATFKRKLKAHNVSFLALQDKARMRECFFKLIVEGHSQEFMAEHLHFNNSANFRRAFKRWFGVAPKESLGRAQFVVFGQ